jgi:hypothetical protein
MMMLLQLKYIGMQQVHTHSMVCTSDLKIGGLTCYAMKAPSTSLK